MAKVSKVKKREVSVHSRAARRATSPSQSGASKATETEYKPWLHSAQNAGVGKKKSKNLTRQQKLRQRRGIEKADITGDKLEKKVEDSKDRARRVQARRADWEALNENAKGKDRKQKVMPGDQAAGEALDLDDAMAEGPAAGAADQQEGQSRAPPGEASGSQPEEIDEIS